MPGVLVIEDVTEECPAEVLVLTLLDGRIEVRETERGNRLVVAYTDYATLAHWCGAGQPWGSMRTTELVDRAGAEGVSLVAVDMTLPDGHRYPAPDVREAAPLPELPTVPGGGQEVWIASRPFNGSHQFARAELHPDESGRLVLLAYSSLESLRAHCGPFQPAVCVPVARVEEVATASGAAAIAMNATLDPAVRHRAPVLDW